MFCLFVCFSFLLLFALVVYFVTIRLGLELLHKQSLADLSIDCLSCFLYLYLTVAILFLFLYNIGNYLIFLNIFLIFSYFYFHPLGNYFFVQLSVCLTSLLTNLFTSVNETSSLSHVLFEHHTCL